MPTAMTFATLTQDLQNYLERGGSSSSDPTVFDQIPRLINAAERKLAQLLKLLGQIEVLRDSVGFQVNNSVIVKPDRWRQTVSMHYGSGTNGLKPLFPRSYEYCRALNPDSTVTGPPEFYSDYNISHWLVVPTPDQTYPMELVAYFQPSLLDAANQSNFWSELTPNALLYASLCEAAPFLRDDPRVAVWENNFQIELVSLSGQDLQRQLDRATERSRA